MNGIAPNETPDTAGNGSAAVTPRRWVVGLDGSDDALVAARWALARAGESAAAGVPIDIVAVMAWSLPMTAPIGVAGTSVLIDWEDVERGVAERLTAAVDTLEHPAIGTGVEIHTLVAQGNAARVLMDHAAGADLLVVGSRGLSGFKQLVLGSVSRQCATHAPVPTVVVPADAPIAEVRRVVVGFDGSANAESAVRWVLEGGTWPIGDATVEVVEAFDISPFTDPDVTRERFREEVVAAEGRFERTLDELDPTERATHTFSLHGARRAIAEAAADADLLVVGTRGRGTIGAALLGSVTTWLLHNTRCAVVVVPSAAH